MSDIQLKVLNRSNDINNSNIVVFQKNVSADANVQTIAWRVIKNLGIGDYHPFTYPMAFEIAAKDANGNYMPNQKCTNGQAFEVIMSSSGHVLQRASYPSSSPAEVQVYNNLSLGDIDAQCYRDGKLLAAKTNVSPGMKASFEFLPKIFIGMVSQIEQGAVMSSNIPVQFLTELDLLGVSEADIVLTGGGGGEEATPFVFQMTNIS